MYHLHVEWEFLVNLPQDCVVCLPLSETELIKKLEDFGPAGVPDRDTIAMFNGQRNAVIKLAHKLGCIASEEANAS